MHQAEMLGTRRKCFVPGGNVSQPDGNAPYRAEMRPNLAEMRPNQTEMLPNRAEMFLYHVQPHSALEYCIPHRETIMQ